MTRPEPTWEDHSKISLLALATNIRLGYKWLTITNTVDYFDFELIKVVKKRFFNLILT